MGLRKRSFFPMCKRLLVVLWTSYYIHNIIRDEMWTHDFKNVGERGSLFFVFWQPRYYKLFNNERIRRVTFLKYSFFWKRTVTVKLKKLSLKPSLDDIFLENCTLSNSIILAEDLIKWKRAFKIFLIDLYDGDIGNRNITG